MPRITSWNLDGYGHFNRFTRETGNSSFVLVYGTNETGKSTLFSFLRGMLSSFPSGRQIRENKYEPLKGGTHGGSITISFNSALLRLTRYQKEKSPLFELPEGSGETEKELAGFLDSLDRNHYKSIFAFDLDELRELSLLDDDSLNEKIFSTALTGSTSIISATASLLRERSRELLKPKSKGILQILEDKLAEILSRKKSLVSEVKEGEELQGTLYEKEEEIRSIEKSILDLDKLVKRKDIESRASSLREQLDKIRNEREELSGFRIPDETHKSLFYRLRAELQVLDTPGDGDSLFSPEKLEDENKILLEKKKSLEELYSLHEELAATDSGIIHLDSSLSVERKKQVFYLMFSVACAIISVILFYFGQTVHATGLAVFSLLSLFFYFRSRKILAAIFSEISAEVSSRDKIAEKMSKVAESCGIDSISEEAIELSLMKVDREINNLAFKTEQLQQKKDSRNRQLLSLHDEMKNFLQSFSCPDMASFEERLSLSDRILTLQTREEEISGILSETLQQHPKESDKETIIQSDIDDPENQRNALRENLHRAISERSELQLRLSRLAGRDLLQSCVMNESSCREEYLAALSEWRAHILATHLLEQSLQQLVNGKYHEVLVTAGEILSEVTDGEYHSVHVQGDKKEIVVTARDGAFLTLRQLSRGTQEQLYLSLRLGLAGHFGNTFYAMPVLLDDVLVNFDETRARNMLKVLFRLSERHQVFLFTCHAWIRRLLEESGEKYHEIVL